MITINDFSKLDIRIGTIESVEKIQEGDKLLKFIIDFGTEKRQIMSAMAEFFPNPSVLIGKQIPVLVNLEYKRFKGYESQGMILASDFKGQPVFLVPEERIADGSTLR